MDKPNYMQPTSLHWAVENEDLNVIALLIKNRASIDTTNYNGKTALHLAARIGNAYIVTTLINAGANVNKADKYGYTPLHYAADEGRDLNIVQLLVMAGSKINKKTSTERTPLHEAASGGIFVIVKYLVENGADINAKDDWGFCPLHEAIQNGRDVVEYLLFVGADIEAKNCRGYTPLHVAVDNANFNFVKYLIEMGAIVDARSLDGLTPLHLAVTSQSIKVVKYLIENGADLNAKDKNNLHILSLFNLNNYSDLNSSTVVELIKLILLKDFSENCINDIGYLIKLQQYNAEHNSNTNLLNKIFNTNLFKMSYSKFFNSALENQALNELYKLDKALVTSIDSYFLNGTKNTIYTLQDQVNDLLLLYKFCMEKKFEESFLEAHVLNVTGHIEKAFWLAWKDNLFEIEEKEKMINILVHNIFTVAFFHCTHGSIDLLLNQIEREALNHPLFNKDSAACLYDIVLTFSQENFFSNVVEQEMTLAEETSNEELGYLDSSVLAGSEEVGS